MMDLGKTQRDRNKSVERISTRGAGNSKMVDVDDNTATAQTLDPTFVQFFSDAYKVMTGGLYFLVGFILLTITDYVMVRYKWTYTLSTPLVWTVEQIKYMWFTFGRWYAIISDWIGQFWIYIERLWTYIERFLNYIWDLINIKDYINSTYDNWIMPIVNFLSSWTQFFVGYIDTVELFNNPIKTFSISLVLCILISVGIYYLRTRLNK